MNESIIISQAEMKPALTAQTSPVSLALVAQEALGGSLTSATLNAPRSRQPESLTQVQITPVLLKGERKYQFAYHQARKVTHRNLDDAEAQAEIVTLLTALFRQAVFHTTQGDIHVLLNKRNEAMVRRGKAEDRRKKEEEGESISAFCLLSSALPASSHDRPKNHLLPEGQPIAFLIGLGVMTTADGRVIAAKRDKFRQINRFLEMTADIVPALEMRAGQSPNRPLRIVDFGCGKAYLTFALYHYLHNVRGLNIALVGVDRKADVLAQCSKLAEELGYKGLHLQQATYNNLNWKRAMRRIW